MRLNHPQTEHGKWIEARILGRLAVGACSAGQLGIALAPISDNGIRHALSRLQARGFVVCTVDKSDIRFPTRVWCSV